MKVFVCLIAMSVPVLAQQLPPLDPAVQLGVCQQQRARFLDDSEKASAYATQFLAEIADLKKRLAEAEAKVLKSKDEPAPN